MLPTMDGLTMKRIICWALGLGFVLVVAASIGLHHWVNTQWHKPMAIKENVTFSVKSGDSVARVAHTFQANGWFAYPRLVILYMRLHQPQATIKTGNYNIRPPVSMVDILTQLIEGHVIQHSVTFIEGKTIQDAIKALHNKPGIIKTLSPNDHQAILSAIGASKHYTHSEGLIYPDTYYFEDGMSDVDILKKAHQRTEQILTQAWQARDTSLPYRNAYEVLIMASIIEKETAVASEREQIAGVFVNRLRKGIRLQTDPTVIYGMGDSYQGNIRKRDLLKPTPYNTYVIPALPPTPIALATEASIHAALNPLLNDKLYFVGKGDGTHYFSSTLQEHNKAVTKYQLNRRDDYRSSPKSP